MNYPLAIGADIGGTHITCAAVNLAEGKWIEKTLSREVYDHEAAADLIFRSWATALNHTLLKTDESRLAGIGFAIPGPFDYRNGISRMQHKFKNLYNIHISTVLNTLLIAEKDLPMRFLNDATAFATGEAWQGQGRSYQKVAVITLGTGFGSAFLDQGVPVVSGERVPKEGCLWHLPFRDGIADDYFSTRWFIGAYEKQTGETVKGVKTLMEKSGSDAFVRSLFSQFGRNLAECAAPWLKKFGAEILIAGGNIAHALPLFEADFQDGIKKAGVAVPIVTSKLMENAALIGSARLMEEAFWEKVKRELPNI
jgi:glucokinase